MSLLPLFVTESEVKAAADAVVVDVVVVVSPLIFVVELALIPFEAEGFFIVLLLPLFVDVVVDDVEVDVTPSAFVVKLPLPFSVSLLPCVGLALGYDVGCNERERSIMRFK